MKTKILEVSVSGLQKDGLRFSVDTISKELRISKKTVYKYFSCKEDLAVAVYEKFYEDAGRRYDSILAAEKGNKFIDLLNLYYQSYCMVREDVFNKFALNDVIRDIALKKHFEIEQIFASVLRTNDTAEVLFIVNSVFEKLNGQSLSEQIAVKLERLL